MKRAAAKLPKTSALPSEAAIALSRIQAAAVAAMAAILIWAYWPTMINLVTAWWNVDDYSHGFLVIPLAVIFLYWRAASRPSFDGQFHAAGLGMIAAAAALRWIGANVFIEAFDGWSLILYVVGIVWLVGGWPVVRWAMPALGFLFFMVPLPYRMETALSLPLQKIAARGSCWLLQSLGQPALQEGTTLVIRDIHLEISRACSGLRMFTGVIALAYVFAVLSKRPWWDKVVILVGAIPAAIVANIIRITATALLYRVFAGEAIRQSIHDFAGWFTIFVAAILLGILSQYLKRLIVESQVVGNRELLSSSVS
ncbi:MAG: exosortase/archaeosortase family protein [Pirellulales bacterium]|nr:exosortase/archaeosortase family protein [Pirellulales bacterium]